MGSGLHGRVPPASPCPRVDHPVSGRFHATCRPFGLAFAPAPAVPALTSRRTTTRWLILQKARRHPPKGAPTGRRHMVSGSVSLPSTGCFSPFPHGTGSLSVVSEYLALQGGPCGFAPRSTCAVLLGCTSGGSHLSPTGLLPALAGRSRPLRLDVNLVTPWELRSAP